MTPTPDLRAHRRALGLRLADVADEAGCSISLVSMVESGYRCSSDRLDAISRAVGASAGHFFPEPA